MKLKEWARIIWVTAMLSAAISFSSLAVWQQDSNGWAYQNDDGTYPKGEWKQIDGSWYYYTDANTMENLLNQFSKVN